MLPKLQARRLRFRHRIRRALILFAVLPSLLVVGVGTVVISRTVGLTDMAGVWERVGASGSELVRLAEASGDPALARAAARHRAELATSVTNARRWEYLLERSMALLPLAGIALGGVLAWLAVRASRRIGQRFARPVDELVGWAGRIARHEPIPAAAPGPGDTDEFATLRDALRRMAEELEASRARELEGERMRAWVGMARTVAHELKNPLTPIRLALRTLQRSAPAGEAERESLEVLEAETARLDELARTFAQLGKLPEGPASEVDLREMMEYLLRTHLPPELSPQLDAPHDLPPVVGHYDALSRAFANLLLNAGDAVARGGEVRVELAERGGVVEVRVQDGGPGIVPEHLERLWEPDFTTKSRGTGLGLALVRQAVRAHGGEVWARNRPGGGAEFGVRLPTARITHPAGRG